MSPRNATAVLLSSLLLAVCAGWPAGLAVSAGEAEISPDTGPGAEEPQAAVSSSPVAEPPALPVASGSRGDRSGRTVFVPPYDACHSWGTTLGGVDNEGHNCNRQSGAIGAYASAFIGGATAEARVRAAVEAAEAVAEALTSGVIRNAVNRIGG